MDNFRSQKRAEFIKMKYDAAIEKYEKEGNDEIADLIKEFSYELVGLERDDPGEL